MPQLTRQIPAHLEGLPVPLAVDVADQLRFAHLIDPAYARNAPRSPERAPVGKPLLRRVLPFDAVRLHQFCKVGIEHVEHEAPVGGEMTRDDLEEAQLIVYGREMLDDA